MAGLHSGGALGALVLSAFARFGERPAIADDATRWTYAELADAVARLITLLRSIGLAKGDAISALSSNRVESWAVICAAAIMGMRYTPLHPMAAEDDHAFIIEDAEIDALVVESGKFAPRGLAIRARVKSLKHLLSFGPVEGARDLLLEWPKCAPAPLVDDSESDQIAWLAYTGGTTGRSKGVMIPHRSIAAMSALIVSDWDWPTDIRYLAATPISHAAGITLYPVMLRGGFARLVNGFDVENWCATVARRCR